ncbi:MAG: hypothetical protein INF43_01815 [Alphaproteobacteria bacterium]|jgi:hypothetical protein|nr:hypothetical protein [Alphaproteobacteria bacterium]
MSKTWLGGDDPNTLEGGINIVQEVTKRTGSFGTAVTALDAARAGDTPGLQATGLGTFGADQAAADVIKSGVFGLHAFDDIFGKKK